VTQRAFSGLVSLLIATLAVMTGALVVWAAWGGVTIAQILLGRLL
jgi:hypothetical protein